MHRPIVLITLLGIAIGLAMGLLDSLFHFIGYEDYKVINIIIFILFFMGIYKSVAMVRDKLLSGFISYGHSVKSTIYVGIIASLLISSVRYLYLKHIANTNIEQILDNTEKHMLDHYSYYPEALIENRLSFIEFSYDPLISSILYFGYYLVIVVIFALIASIFLRKIDRNISL